jgi:hypothetical protein
VGDDEDESRLEMGLLFMMQNCPHRPVGEASKWRGPPPRCPPKRIQAGPNSIQELKSGRIFWPGIVCPRTKAMPIADFDHVIYHGGGGF